MWRSIVVAVAFVVLTYAVLVLPTEWKLVAGAVLVFLAVAAVLLARSDGAAESPLETIRRVLSNL